MAGLHVSLHDSVTQLHSTTRKLCKLLRTTPNQTNQNAIRQLMANIRRSSATFKAAYDEVFLPSPALIRRRANSAIPNKPFQIGIVRSEAVVPLKEQTAVGIELPPPTSPQLTKLPTSDVHSLPSSQSDPAALPTPNTCSQAPPA